MELVQKSFLHLDEQDFMAQLPYENRLNTGQGKMHINSPFLPLDLSSYIQGHLNDPDQADLDSV
ncbi:MULTISPECIES: hypothetical protein [unclassified Moorena]|uniref:hypothetical protein n=1 Tax=unclassified Moorena TaxID=2683338 RepID=UPI0013FF52E7|nr:MULTISPECIES: hypothetical protein [unclassified Moorena]NEO16408.1 hypothetical protein [Moorena sp. SIO3E8]NEQ03189.1 hypothetical protein [Moorena sp. SIO3F7]